MFILDINNLIVDIKNLIVDIRNYPPNSYHKHRNPIPDIKN